MIVLQSEAGGIARNPEEHGAAQQSGVEDGRMDASGQGRQRERRRTLKGTARPPLTHSTASMASAARRPGGPQASGIKAAWPRLGTRRGATPASPTAVRRDALPGTFKNRSSAGFGVSVASD